MLRGCLWSVGIVVGIFVLGFIYLMLNPPLGNADTGYLSTSVDREVALSPASPTAAFRVRVRPTPGIYAGASRPFEPLTIRAAVVTDGAPATGPELRLYPVDGLPIDLLEISEDGRTVTWRMGCDQREADRPCPRDYLLVVAAPPTNAADVRLELFAEQKFPQYTPTPFMVSIGVDAEPVELPETTQLLTEAAASSVRLSSDAPVARWSLVVPAADPGPGGGTVLTASVERIGDVLPAGLRAPAPVQVAVVDGSGRIAGQVEARPGAPGTIVLPHLAGAHRLIAWWDDRADQEYEVAWSLERARLGSGAPPVVLTGDPALPAFRDGEPTEGSTEVVIGQEEVTVPLYMQADLGMTDAERLRSWHGVLLLRILAEPVEASEDPLLIELVPAGDAGGYDAERVPVVVRSGEVAEIALAAVPSCQSSPCDTWMLHVPGEPGGSEADTPARRRVRISWQGVVRLWPLGATGQVGRS
jgi:hypothetical protein